MDTLQFAAYLAFAAVAGCTVFNVYSVVSVRSGERVSRLDVRMAAWCALAALAGSILLVVAIAG